MSSCCEQVQWLECSYVPPEYQNAPEAPPTGLSGTPVPGRTLTPIHLTQVLIVFSPTGKGDLLNI